MNKTISIMQPTYLPWAGYFNLMTKVNTFVFLDNVQFSRHSWQSRNRILLQGNEHYLSIPIQKRMPLKTLILDVESSLTHQDWKNKHWEIIKNAYSKTTYGKILLNILEPHYNCNGIVNVADFNIGIILDIANVLDLNIDFIRASNLECIGARSERISSICNILEGNVYLSPMGAHEYLKEDKFENKSNILLTFQSFEPSPYVQYLSNNFISHLSIIDVIANIGLNATKLYIKG